MSGEHKHDTSSSGEENFESPPRVLTLTEAQKLRKKAIEEQLRKRGVQFDEGTDRDTLRSRLVELVRLENSGILENVESKATVEPRAEYSSAIDNTAAGASSTDDKQTSYEDENKGAESESESAHESSSDETMSKDTKIFFHLETDDWEAFTERLELYFEVKKITDAATKRAELLTRCDESTYQLYRNLCAPNKPATKAYDDLIKLLTNHLKPAPSEVMERCTYNRARQEQHETITEFAARLRQLSLHCNYTNLDTALRDQLICGIRDEATRIELFKQTTVTFESALKEATARERAVANAAGALKTLSDKTYKQESFAMDHATANRQEQQASITNKDKKPYPKNGTSPKQDSKRVCYCCGNTEHATKSCKYRELTCRFCNTKDHLERACIRKKKMSNKFLQVKDETNHEHDNAANTTESSNYVDFHAINSAHDNYICNMTGLKADPMFMQVKINDKTINMEVDTGSYFAVMSEGFVKNNFKNIKITNATVHLLGYEDNTMTPLGQLENLKVSINRKAATLSSLILKGNKEPLIGRQWLKALGLWPLNVINNSDITAKLENDFNKIDAINVRETVLSQFKQLFSDTPGVYNKREVKLHVKQNSRPVAVAARHVPYALKPRVEQEIERLHNLGHLERVEASEWATPIVPVLKGNGKVRICGDFKITVNPHLQISKRTFPRIYICKFPWKPIHVSI